MHRRHLSKNRTHVLGIDTDIDIAVLLYYFKNIVFLYLELDLLVCLSYVFFIPEQRRRLCIDWHLFKNSMALTFARSKFSSTQIFVTSRNFRHLGPILFWPTMCSIYHIQVQSSKCRTIVRQYQKRQVNFLLKKFIHFKLLQYLNRTFRKSLNFIC